MSGTRIPDDVLLAMEEAASLGADAPERLAFEASLPHRAAVVRARWTDIARETDALRRAFGAPRAPVGFEARLLALPDAPPRRTWLRWTVRAAAAMILVVAGVLGGKAAWTSHRASVVAGLAAANHASDAHVTVASSDAIEVAAALSASLPFRVRVPLLAAGTEVVGGRKCALDGAPVAYVALRGGDMECALYVFEADSLGLPGAMDRRMRTVRTESGASALVEVWSVDGTGYALVSPAARVLDTK